MTEEIGHRASVYMEVENSDWAYKFWFMTSEYWWNPETGKFVKETRPEILA